ncbi:MAG: M23 family metallopeptidase [Anaerolinea sp.]|nr:M23 family metallopeptidase [Anaerolinea sp.]
MKFARIFFLLIFFLAACQPISAPPTPAPLPSPSPVLPDLLSIPGEALQITPAPHTTPQALLNEAPLRPSFSASAEPSTLWRPPLYEAPLAISPYDHFYFTRPIAVNTVNWPLGDYRYGYYFPGLEVVHIGVDIDAQRGSPVLAAGPGRVIFTGYGLQLGRDDPADPYGQAVMIEHDFGYRGQALYTVYGHMDRVDVIRGQRAETGTQLGLVGNTGATTGPHLHFEVRVGSRYGSFQNPELWVTPPLGMGVLAGRMQEEDDDPITSLDVELIYQPTNKIYPARTYAGRTYSEPFFRENLARGDLPAGNYTLHFVYDSQEYFYPLTIQPGTVNYFTFHATKGFSTGLPTISNISGLTPAP